MGDEANFISDNLAFHKEKLLPSIVSAPDLVDGWLSKIVYQI